MQGECTFSQEEVHQLKLELKDVREQLRIKERAHSKEFLAQKQPPDVSILQRVRVAKQFAIEGRWASFAHQARQAAPISDWSFSFQNRSF